MPISIFFKTDSFKSQRIGFQAILGAIHQLKILIFDLGVAPLDSSLEHWTINGEGHLQLGGRVFTMQLYNHKNGWVGPFNLQMLTPDEQAKWNSTTPKKKFYFECRGLMWSAFKKMCSAGDANTCNISEMLDVEKLNEDWNKNPAVNQGIRALHTKQSIFNNILPPYSKEYHLKTQWVKKLFAYFTLEGDDIDGLDELTWLLTNSHMPCP